MWPNSEEKKCWCCAIVNNTKCCLSGIVSSDWYRAWNNPISLRTTCNYWKEKKIIWNARERRCDSCRLLHFWFAACVFTVFCLTLYILIHIHIHIHRCTYIYIYTYVCFVLCIPIEYTWGFGNASVLSDHLCSLRGWSGTWDTAQRFTYPCGFLLRKKQDRWKLRIPKCRESSTKWKVWTDCGMGWSAKRRVWRKGSVKSGLWNVKCKM